MATKEKINILEVIPCRNEHIKAEQEGEDVYKRQVLRETGR